MKPRAPLYNTRPINSKPIHGNVVHSDHDAFFGGLVTGNLSSMNGMGNNGMGNDILDFFKPIVQKVTANTQASVGTAITNLANNQLANNPALQATATNKISETIKNAILDNKWYIIGGIVLIAGSFVLLNKASNIKLKKAAV